MESIGDPHESGQREWIRIGKGIQAPGQEDREEIYFRERLGRVISGEELRNRIMTVYEYLEQARALNKRIELDKEVLRRIQEETYG